MRIKRIAALLLFLLAPAALAAERVALVVGNADYEQEIAALKNPVNDATAVAAALRRMGCEVIEGTDLDRDGFFDKIIEFDDAAREAEIALFFYAGHGLQVDRSQLPGAGRPEAGEEAGPESAGHRAC